MSFKSCSAVNGWKHEEDKRPCAYGSAVRPVSEKIRAFLSIDVDDNALLPRIAYIQNKLDRESAKIKLIESDSIHFTLRFFGDVSIAASEQMYECLKEIRFQPFDITISGVGAFPSPRRPNVIWVGVSRNHELVRELKKRIDESLATQGYALERDFTPHATIARVKAVKNRERLSENITSISSETVGTLVVDRFRLTKSVLTPTRPIYTTVWEVPGRV